MSQGGGAFILFLNEVRQRHVCKVPNAPPGDSCDVAQLFHNLNSKKMNEFLSEFLRKFLRKNPCEFLSKYDHTESPLTCFHSVADRMKEAVATTPTAISMKSSVTVRNLLLLEEIFCMTSLMHSNAFCIMLPHRACSSSVTSRQASVTPMIPASANQNEP